LTPTVHLELFVKDLQKSVDFYQTAIQLELSSQNETSALLKSKNLNLLLTKEEVLSPHHYFAGIDHTRKGVGVEIIIVVEDVRGAYRRIRERNIAVESELKEQPWGMTDFRVIDPDGYYLRITSSKKGDGASG